MRVARTFAIAALLAVPGCFEIVRLQPVQGGDVASATRNGVTLEADPDSWNGDPEDLQAYVTPIEVRLVNGTGRELRVSFADFALVDDRGFRYPAVNPYGRAGWTEPQDGAPRAPAPSPPAGKPSPGNAPPSSAPPAAPPANPSPPASEADPPQAMAPAGGGIVAAAWDGDGSGSWIPAAYRGGRGGRGGYRGGGDRAGGGYHGGYGGYRGYGWHREPRGYVRPYGGFGWYGYHDPWWVTPWPWWYAPSYRVWVYDWNAYEPGEPTEDILRYGLPEGVIQPGGEVAGFVYFRSAGTRAARLTLAWRAHSPDGQPVAEVSVPFRVLR